MAAPQTTAIIVAAGRGERFGGGDKVLLPLAGKPVLGHVLHAVERAETVGSVVIVAGSQVRSAVDELLGRQALGKPYRVVNGGARRQDSVAAGFGVVPEGAVTVVILDGARPLTSGELIDRCVAAAGTGSAIAAMPVSDTLKRVNDAGMIETTVPREGLWAAQTPQVFPVTRLREAFCRVGAEGVTYTDEASLFETLGWPVRVVRGDPANLKITWPGDVERAERLLGRPMPAACTDG